ncbi:MAG: 30S ribosomal protein S18 [Lentisphaerae bacterium]|nr:MAG: 30S ribosomal protein S18 [Lentisphaerota bacterium]
MATRKSNSSNRRKRNKRIRKKVCRFCEEKVNFIGFRDLDILSKNLTERGRILPRRITGTCAVHQKMLATAIKQARNLALVR